MKKAHHGRKPREQTTSAGNIRVSRIYLKCPQCGDAGYSADDRLGIEGRYSKGAERLACLAAGGWSYAVSSERLAELCGIEIAQNTIRAIAQKRGAAMNAWQSSDPEACREFRESDGFTEFTTDGTCVNTLEGWREMKVGIFAKRAAGESATPSEWADRDLPSPSVSVAFSAIEASDRSVGDGINGLVGWEFWTLPTSRFWRMEPSGFGRSNSLIFAEHPVCWIFIMRCNTSRKRPACCSEAAPMKLPHGWKKVEQF